MGSERRLIHVLSSNSWGGIERYALDVCSYFGSCGWCVSVYTRDAQVVDSELRKGGIDIRHAQLGGLSDLVSVVTLSRDFKREAHGGVIHVHNVKDAFTVMLARLISRRKDLRVVMTHHKVKRGVDTTLYKWIYRNIDYHIFVSEMSRAAFLKAWSRGGAPVNENKLRVLHNSIYYQPGGRIEEPDAGPTIAMFHGRLSEEKGVEDLIDALPQLKGKRVRLWIVGTGDPDYVDRLKRRAVSLGVMEMIDWRGYVKDVHELIRHSHFGVLPSRWEEGFGLANIEYMSEGRPHISTNNGAQVEYMRDGIDGLMVAPRDPSALSRALMRLVDDVDCRKKMGCNAYSRFETTLSWGVFAAEIEKIYKG